MARRSRRYERYDSRFPVYVPVSERRAKAAKEMEKLRQKGKDIQPVVIEGRLIARSFWGKGWCDHLESFSDYENRLPRGRTYVRNGSVCHLEIQAGRIEAVVSGSELYKVSIEVKPLPPAKWKSVKAQCQGRIGSMLELLQGRLSDHVMTAVSDADKGLFPHPKEIALKCSCPDWATLCKHVAAVLYGVGSRLDTRPELLFLLRGVEAAELISGEVALPDVGAASEDALASDGLSAIFGIELETPSSLPPLAAPTASAAERKKPRSRIKSSPKPALPAKEMKGRTETPSARKVVRNPESKASGGPKKDKRAPKKDGTRSAPTFNPAAPTGKTIAQLRLRADLTEDAFAVALKVSVASVRRWESVKGLLRLQSGTIEALIRFQERYVQEKP